MNNFPYVPDYSSNSKSSSKTSKNPTNQTHYSTSTPFPPSISIPPQLEQQNPDRNSDLKEVYLVPKSDGTFLVEYTSHWPHKTAIKLTGVNLTYFFETLDGSKLAIPVNI